ncbi:MAG: DUF1501 domain-containing protein [Polyangiaceae bacterium]
MIKRRDAVTAALFGGGYLGLRAIATGLPAWYLANPRSATAQDLACAISAKDKLQFLVVAASSNGDPINCNCPGTYEAASAIHPTDAKVARVDLKLGSKTYGAALPWAGTDVSGALAPATLSRINFFHYRTGSVVHGDQAKVMKMMGQTNRGEMLISVYAKYLASCLGTVQSDPISVGAGRNASELLSFQGRPAANVSPLNLKAMLGGSSSGSTRASGASALKSLRTLRDQTLDQLNELAKRDSTRMQGQFLDALASSQRQVRQLSDTLASTLSSISADDIKGQALAAAALISAKVTPVVSMHIPFGGDNHSDQNLQAEADQLVTGVQGVQALMDALAKLGLQDQVTFATLNVFGRNLDGISKVTSRSGRDHYANHAVAVLVGKNIAPGVTGGVMPGGGGSSFGSPSTALGAADIDSATGAAQPGGDVPSMQTYGALARTLGVALGIPASSIAADLTSTAGGKVINSALNGVSG